MEGFNLVINGDEAPANTLHWIGFDANAYFKLFVWDNFPTRAEK